MHAKLDKMEKYFEELIIDYLTGNLSDPDIARFLEFVQSDERHRRRFEELSRLYAQSLIPRFETDKKARYREAEWRIAASRRRPSLCRLDACRSRSLGRYRRGSRLAFRTPA